jgi:hypothetical protein
MKYFLRSRSWHFINQTLYVVLENEIQVKIFFFLFVLFDHFFGNKKFMRRRWSHEVEEKFKIGGREDGECSFIQTTFGHNSFCLTCKICKICFHPNFSSNFYTYSIYFSDYLFSIQKKVSGCYAKIPKVL